MKKIFLLSIFLLSFETNAGTIKLKFININCDITPDDNAKVTTIKNGIVDENSLSLSSDRVDLFSVIFSPDGLAQGSAKNFYMDNADGLSHLIIELGGLTRYVLSPSFIFSPARPVTLSEIKITFTCQSPHNNIPKNLINMNVEMHDENKKLIPYIKENKSPFRQYINNATHFFWTSPSN